jgi:hypothetical protein
MIDPAHLVVIIVSKKVGPSRECGVVWLVVGGWWMVDGGWMGDLRLGLEMRRDQRSKGMTKNSVQRTFGSPVSACNTTGSVRDWVIFHPIYIVQVKKYTMSMALCLDEYSYASMVCR